MPVFIIMVTEYEIIKEVYGNKVNKDYLHAYILNSVLIGREIIDLEEINAYENQTLHQQMRWLYNLKTIKYICIY